ERVFQAIKEVRADEIFLFRTLTWTRWFGRPGPSEPPNPRQRPKKKDFVRSHFFDGLENTLSRRVNTNRVKLFELVHRHKLVEQRVRPLNPCLFCRQRKHAQDEKQAAAKNGSAPVPARN